MVELTKVYGIPERDFLRFANESLTTMKVDDLGKARRALTSRPVRLGDERVAGLVTIEIELRHCASRRPVSESAPLA